MSILLPEKSRVRSLAVSPDGRQIAMVLVKDGKQQIWVRALDSLEPLLWPEPMAPTIPSGLPTAGSSRFFADAKLKKIERSGGPVQTLCDALAASGRNLESQRRHPDSAASARVQTSLGRPAEASAELPAARSGSYPVVPARWAALSWPPISQVAHDPGIWLILDRLGRIPPDRCRMHSKAEVVEPPPGQSRRRGAVHSRRNADGFAVRHEAAGGRRGTSPDGAAGRSARLQRGWPLPRGNGVLAYVSGQQTVAGNTCGAIGRAKPRRRGLRREPSVMISPDGKRLVGDRGQICASWISARESQRSLMFGPAAMNPSGRRMARYVANQFRKRVGIYRKPANGAGEWETLTLAAWPDGSEELVARRPIHHLRANQSRNGRGPDGDTGRAECQAVRLAQTPATEDQGQFSPDGHWVAYTSNESGLSEIYVIPFPPSPRAAAGCVSSGGGVMPRWRRDGKELFYISPDSRMMAVDVVTSPRIPVRQPPRACSRRKSSIPGFAPDP